MKAGVCMIFLLAALMAVGALPADAAMDMPHSGTVNCDTCHVPAPSANWWTDQKASGGLCAQCHNAGSGFGDAMPHVTTSAYGDLTLQCTVCHDPHYQRQLRSWKAGNASYQTTGVVTGVGPTSLTMTGAGWTDNQWAGMLLVPNISYVQYNFKIDSNTSDTIIISSGSIPLAYVTPNVTTFGITYGKFVRQTIGGRSVKFFRQTGTNSFADGDATIDGVCQVCHTRTPLFNTAGAINGGNHPPDKAGENCTEKCHSHKNSDGGFQPSCGSCHGSPPTVTSLGGPDGLAKYDDLSGTGSAIVGKHQKHAVDLAYACENCHTGYVMPQFPAKTIDIGFSNFGLYQSGNYTGQSGLHYVGQNGTNASDPGTGTVTCSNIYCHSTVQSGTDGTGAPTYQNVTWTGTAMTCSSCHASTPATGSHTPHLAISGVNCDTCHGANNHVGNIVNGRVNVPLGGYKGGVPSVPQSGFGTCNAASCHTNVQSDGGGAGSSVTTPVWGTVTACGECHKGRKTDPTTMDTGKHTKHLSYANIDCVNCHNGVGDGTGSHFDNNIQVVFNAFSGSGSYSDMPTNTPGTGYGTCSSTYCHGAGAPSWGGGPLACNQCHLANSTLAGKHSKHYGVTTVATSSDTTASNTSTGTAYKFSCGVCHNGTAHVNGTVSANQAAQVSLDATIAVGGSYTPGGSVAGTDTGGFKWTNGTCASTYCHSQGRSTTSPFGGAPNTTPTWNGAALSCEGCHHYNEGATNKMNTGNHTEHIFNSGVIGKNYGCQECHNTTTSDGTSITNEANHVNKFRDVSILKGGSWLSPNCSSVYCHSSGQATTAYRTVPAWGNTTDLTCDGCHGTEGGTAYGEPAYPNGTQPTVVENNDNSHSAHVSAAADCAKCHTDTVDAAGTAIKSGSTLHTNQTRNVNFAATYDTNGGTNSDNYNAATKTCSSISCHGTGTPMWGGASMNCTDCHLGTGDIDDFVYGGGSSTARIDSTEWTTTGHGKTGSPLPLTCEYCHSNSVTTVYHADSANPYRLVNYNVSGKGWNDVCLVCHLTGSSGYNPGSGNKNSSLKINKYHYGGGHNSSRSGGQYCFDCHDPHGDSNIKMIHAKPFKASDANGLPTALPTNPVIFTNIGVGAGAGGFARTSAPFENGLCNTCHTAANSPHYSSTSVDGTHYTAVCTGCHQHSKDTTYDNKAFAGGDDCFDCHSSAGGPTPGTETTRDAYHARHVQTAFIGKLSLGDYGRLTGGSGPNWYTYSNVGGVPDMGCGYCHPTSSANHNNGSIDLNFNPTDTGATGTLKAKNHTTQTYTQVTRTTVVCSSVYCHSNGYNPGPGYGYQPTDNWYTVTPSGDLCGKCHGNFPNVGISGSAAHPVHAVGIHYDDIFNGTSGLKPASTRADILGQAAGDRPHGNSATATTINCNVCHTGTVTAAYNATSSVCSGCHSDTNTPATGDENMTIAAGSTLHVNGTIEVSLANITSPNLKSKAQIRGTVAPTPWTRNNGYKAANANDSHSLASGERSGNNCTVACHMDQTVTWTTPVTCSSCHTTLP